MQKKKIRIFTATAIFFSLLLVGGHEWRGPRTSSHGGRIEIAFAVKLGILEFLRVGRLALWKSSFILGVREILAEAARLAFVLIVESLIERRGKSALSPHKGNRRRIPTSPEQLELMEMMLFTFSRMRYRRRRRFAYK